MRQPDTHLFIMRRKTTRNLYIFDKFKHALFIISAMEQSTENFQNYTDTIVEFNRHL